MRRIIGMTAFDLEREKKERYLINANNKTLAASLLGISRKCIYHKGIKEDKDLSCKHEIENLHLTHPAYGHKRVALALKWDKNKAIRIMNKYGIKPPRRKRRKLYLTRSVDNNHYTNLI